MIIQFQPTGALVNLDHLTPNGVKAGVPPAFPVIEPNQFGGNLTSGNFAYFNAAAGVARVYWNTVSNAVSQIWQMDNNAAIDTLMQTINTALTASDAFIIVGSDGALYTGS
jgi:hypothetical protein